jgi:AcrR family transcriptional regulator
MAASKERLCEAAVRLFTQRGYSETSVGDIEEAAGLTPRAGGFYRHFKSKEAVLLYAVEQMAEEMIADLTLSDVTALKAPRAELLVIARALMRHAALYRPLRLLMQREGHKMPTLRKAAKRANARLAALDVVPWVEDAMKRAGVRGRNARETGLIIFGPVLVHILALDRGDAAFGLKDEHFLDGWADHWAGWFARGGRD